LAETQEEVAHGVGAGKTIDAKQGVKGFVCPKPVGMSQAAGSGHHRNHKCHKSLGRWDGVAAGVGEWHQPADLPGQPNLLEEGSAAMLGFTGLSRLAAEWERGSISGEMPSASDASTRFKTMVEASRVMVAGIQARGEG
jgi:hypothetical protein